MLGWGFAGRLQLVPVEAEGDDAVAFHLAHDAASVNFDGALARAQGECGLAIAFSICQKLGDLAFARSELAGAALKLVEFE